MDNVLVTGGAGFIGSNFLNYMVIKYPNLKFINFDKLTYAGNLENTSEINQASNYEFIKGDISNKSQLNNLFEKYKFKGIYNFAAESHVDNSISGPEEFINTNIYGTFCLLEAAKNLWLDAEFNIIDKFANARLLHVSTDEVYGTLGTEGLFTENTAYAPNSPYSASKASSDFLVRSYYHTYGLNVVTTNCSNNYGPKQHIEKLIPTIIYRALQGENIPVYGDGKNVRDWLYVLDHCKGIELTYLKGRTGETYNIGGRNEMQNIDVVRLVCELLDELKPKEASYSQQICFVKDRPGHDLRYAIDATKIESELGWLAEENFKSGIRKTVEWYLKVFSR